MLIPLIIWYNLHTNFPFSAVYMVVNTATEPCRLKVKTSKPLLVPHDHRSSRITRPCYKGLLNFYRSGLDVRYCPCLLVLMQCCNAVQFHSSLLPGNPWSFPSRDRVGISGRSKFQRTESILSSVTYMRTFRSSCQQSHFTITCKI